MKKISFETILEDGENKWMFAYDHNGLYCDCDGFKFVGKVPWEKEYGARLYSKILKYNNKIFLIPFSAKDIAVYNILDGKFSRIEIPRVSSIPHGNNKNDVEKFVVAEICEDSVVLLPFFYAAIVKIDANTEAVTLESKLLDEIDKVSLKWSPYVTDIYVEDKKAWCSIGCADAIACIDLKTLEFKLFGVHSGESGYVGITKDNNNIWLAPRIGYNAVVFDIESKKKSVIDLSQYVDEVFLYPFLEIHKCEEQVVFVPQLCDKWIVVNMNSLSVSTDDKLTEIVSKNRENYCYGYNKVMASSLNGNNLKFVGGLDNKVYSYDLTSHDLTYQSFELDSKYPDLDEIVKHMSLDEHTLIFGENEHMSLGMFIDYVTEK